MMCIPHPFMFRAGMHEQAVCETIHLLLGLHTWSAQGAVDVVFHTHVCVKVGLPGLAVVDHTFNFRLALQLVQGDNGALHTHLCYKPDCFMVLVVDHAFLPRLALRSALCDDAFFH